MRCAGANAEEVVMKHIWLAEYPSGIAADVDVRRYASLVQILEETQKAMGYLSPEAIGYVADYLNVSREKVVEAAAFYPVFRMEPPARYRISLCRGETCSKNGSDDLQEAIGRTLSISSGETTPDGMFSLETVPCRGMCSHGPVVSINDRVLDVKNGDDLARALRALSSGDGK